MLTKLKNYFGFCNEKDIDVVYPETFDFADNLNLKMEYLKSLDNQESNRQSFIESKTSQLIGQTGIIFSLLGLFISNYISKFINFPLILQILLISIFITTLLFYLLTIFQATKYLNIHKYKYGQRSVLTVQRKFNTEDDFKIEEIKDLIYSIERNTLVNNQKCNNLIYAYRSFRIGTLGVGILSVLILLSAYFMSQPTSSKTNNVMGMVNVKCFTVST